MVDIFDEISNDLRADRVRALLIRLGGAAVGLLVLLLAAVGLFQWRQARIEREDQRVASLFFAAAATVSAPAAIASFQTVEHQGHPAYAALARLREAALRDQSGDHAGALVLWDQVAGAGDVPAAIRDLALLLWVQHQIDGGDPSLLAGRVSPLLAAGNLWHGLAAEEMALLALRQGKTDQARLRLETLLTDFSLSQNLRSRAAVLLTSLGA